MSKQNRVRVYIQPFDTLGNYTGTWTEVTKDVVFDDLGEIQGDLDNVEYTLGVFRVNSVSLSLINEFGLYSDVDVQQSMFRYRRAGSLVKFVWDIEYDGNYCGTAICGDAYLTDDSEKILFTGLLDDSSLSLNLLDRKQKFTVLGRESSFSSVDVPYSSLSGTDLVSDLIFKMLDQTAITDVLTVNPANIVPGEDQIPDDLTGYQNKTVKEALDDLLLHSNSVLYVKDDAIYVSARTPTAAVQYTFHGQASETHRENIIGIQNLKNGSARTFNYLTWKDTTLLVKDATSVDHYGTQKKEFDTKAFTNTTKRTNILNSILAEFKTPLMELDLIAPLNYDTFPLTLLDRIAIDYPTVYVASGGSLPVIGIAVIGVDILPRGLWSFTIDTDTNFKIIGKRVNLQQGRVTFKLRKV